MTALSPAETLTAAAKLVRERATADYVTPGPWVVHQANGFVRVDLPGPPCKAWTEKSGADLAEENRGTAEYIALMHPGVGLALADWLEDAGRAHAARVEAASRVWPDPAAALKWVEEQADQKALAVARQLLGVAS